VLQDNMVGFSIAGIMVYLIGFAQYGTALFIQWREKKSPWYMFQHAYYFGHDFTFVLSFSLWFKEMDFWLFKLLWAGCVIFCFIEIFSLYMTVKNERDEVFGQYAKPGERISEKQAWGRGIASYIIAFLIFYLARIGLGDTCCLMLMMSTNWIVAVFPQFIVEKRHSREGHSLILGALVILGTIFTFAPQGIGFWATASSTFRGAWFNIAGIIALICAVRYFVLLLRLPKKEVLPNGKKPVL